MEKSKTSTSGDEEAAAEISPQTSEEKNRQTFLWQARQRSGLSLKEISFLLGRRHSGDFGKYESGEVIPSLNTALKLEAIYRVPVRLLFYELFADSYNQIKARLSRHAELFPELQGKNENLAKHLEAEDYCNYTQLLSTPNLPVTEIQKIHDHALFLVTTLGEIRRSL